MAETSVYFEAAVNARSVLLSDEASLEGTTTLSLETQMDMSESDVFSYIQENFAEFLRTIRFLSKEDQELLLGYYVISKTQTTLAPIHRFTQTLCSARLRLSLKKLANFLILGQRPNSEIMKPIFEKAGVENLLSQPMSKVVEMYSQTRSFQRVAEVLDLPRPEVRRQMRQAQKTLEQSADMLHQSMGAFLLDLIDKASANGRGYSSRKLAKMCDLYVKTPSVLGKFRINLSDPDFEQFFTSRANKS